MATDGLRRLSRRGGRTANDHLPAGSGYRWPDSKLAEPPWAEMALCADEAVGSRDAVSMCFSFHMDCAPTVWGLGEALDGLTSRVERVG
ncbi:MAG: hypothetical protein KDB71_16385 [Mycobacterium sp.]|nr:hypothetical protein [Mycobacterium sp.]